MSWPRPRDVAREEERDEDRERVLRWLRELAWLFSREFSRTFLPLLDFFILQTSGGVKKLRERGTTRARAPFAPRILI
jgi:hypothetical protein